MSNNEIWSLLIFSMIILPTSIQDKPRINRAANNAKNALVSYICIWNASFVLKLVSKNHSTVWKWYWLKLFHDLKDEFSNLNEIKSQICLYWIFCQKAFPVFDQQSLNIWSNPPGRFRKYNWVIIGIDETSIIRL